MDGVLVDNNEFHYRSFEMFCHKYQLPMNPEIYNNHITGRTNEMILEYLFKRKIEPEESARLAFEKEAIYRDLFRPSIQAAPGLKELLAMTAQKNIPCAVASNGPIENIDFVLDETGIRPYFSVVINASMVKQGKPAPDIYLKAAELLGKSTDECIVFEDSPIGIKAARAAQIKVIGLTTTHREDELHDTEFIIQDFTDPRLKDVF
jgi:beta-phosphoglucomutase